MEDYGISIDVLQLSSMGSLKLPDDVLEKVNACREYFKELEQSLTIIDYQSYPFGIFAMVRDYARKNGRFYYKGVEVNPVDSKFDTYVANDPNEYVIVIVDHIGLLEPENTNDTNTLHSAMSKFSATYCRKNITKHYKYVAVLVQQQSADKEKVQFTYKGDSIEAKLEPSLDGLGDNKLTQRDAHVVIGLFSPERYGIADHRGINITKLKDYYRSISILKNRLGRPNLKAPLYFDGATNYFAVLPEKNTEELRKLYASMS